MRVVPDGLTAALMAVEGISDARVYLHGPGGCRLYHMISAMGAYPRLGSDGTYDYNVPFFFGHPRVPASYVEGEDYIYGAGWRLEQGLRITDSFDCEVIAIVDSPGASLIGDDCMEAVSLAGLDGKAIHLDQGLMSHTATEGFDTTLERMIELFADPCPERDPKAVNILGLSIMDRDWMVVREEIVALLESMGLKANCILGAGCSMDEIRGLGRASVSATVCPDMSARQEAVLGRMFGTVCVRSDHGAAIGFGPTKELVRNIARAMGVDPTPALEKIGDRERRVFNVLMGEQGMSSRIRGMSFAVAGLPSVAYALSSWLYEYLRISPVSVFVDDCTDDCHVADLREFLTSIGFGDSFGRLPESADIFFCESSASQSAELSGRCRVGVDIGMEGHGQVSVMERPIYLSSGAMYILDEVCRSLRGQDSH